MKPSSTHLHQTEKEQETFTDQTLTVTPWWGISIGLHLLAGIVLALPFISDPVHSTDLLLTIKRHLPESKEPPKESPVELEFGKTLDVEKIVEQPIRIQAEESDHNESDNNEDFAPPISKSIKSVIDQPFEGQSTNEHLWQWFWNFWKMPR